MKITTKTEVTLVLTGAEANALAIALFEAGYDRVTNSVGQLLHELQQLPEE